MKPYYQDDYVTLYHGDCLDVLRALPDASVDSVCTDPPYGLEFMGKEWDKFAQSARRVAGTGGTDAPFASHAVPLTPARGREFQRWCEAWAAECLRVLKPGGHLLAFGGTRTWHRLACAIEDAGFDIRDNIAWLYGQGFPKSLDVSKAIDKGEGENRARQLEFTAWMRSTGVTAAQINAATDSFMGSHYLTDKEQAAIATADMFDKLRPLLPEVPERIERLVAERTGIEWTDYVKRRVVEERRTTDRRGDGTVVGLGHSGVADVTAAHSDEAKQWEGWGTALKPAFEPVVVARKPLSGTVAANVLAHGTGALNIDGCRVEAGDGPRVQGAQRSTGATNFGGEREGGKVYTSGRWPANVVLDESQAAALDKQSGERTSGALKPYTERHENASSFRMERDKTYEKAADTGGASRFFYVAKAPASERPRHNGTAHPTVKPLTLMSWLVRLVTPPGGTVLEPFAGSGTTVEACIVEGVHCIAIEREADYLPLIMQRVNRRRDPVAYIEAAGDDLGRKCVLIEREERYCEIAARRMAQGVLDFGTP